MHAYSDSFEDTYVRNKQEDPRVSSHPYGYPDKFYVFETVEEAMADARLYAERWGGQVISVRTVSKKVEV